MYVEIEAASLYSVFYNASQDVDDLIFRTMSKKQRGVGDNLIATNDKDYKNPDRALYVFSNMADNNLSVIHNNNMVTGVRNKRGLNSVDLHNEITQRTQRTSSYTSCTGVYVVETYTIYNDGSANLDRILKYYTNSLSIEYPKDVIDNILKELHNKITVNRYSPVIELRIVIFIPDYEINRVGYMYIPGANIVIAKGNIDNVAHPNSRAYKDRGKHNNNIGTTNINIELVDNDMVSYYFKIGDEVIKLFSDKNSEREQGGYIEIRRGDSVIKSTKLKLEELNTIGLYKSYDDANASGDIKAKVELEKLSYEYSKLEYNYKKLDYDYNKLITGYEHQRMKLEAENNHMNTKHNIEVSNMQNKHKMEMAKKYIDTSLDISKYELDTKLMLTKYRVEHDILLTKFKLDKEQIMHKFYMQSLDRGVKMKKENTRDSIKLIKELVSFGATLIKLF